MNDLSPPPQYVTRDGDALRDRDTVLSIWHGNLGQEDRIAAKYEWFYLGCPYGSPVLQLLHYTPDGADIGTACAGRRRMLWRGEQISAGVLVDLAVLPAHRSLGPALILQQALIQSGLRQLDLLYGRVEKVVLTWEGEAREVFIDELDKWDHSADDLRAAQKWLHEVVTKGHINYAAAHRSVLRGWGAG